MTLLPKKVICPKGITKHKDSQDNMQNGKKNLYLLVIINGDSYGFHFRDKDFNPIQKVAGNICKHSCTSGHTLSGQPLL